MMESVGVTRGPWLLEVSVLSVRTVSVCDYMKRYSLGAKESLG